MAKHRHQRTGEAETDLTFRTSVYPIDNDRNHQLFLEIEAMIDSDRCRLECAMCEVRITRLTHDYARMVQLLLDTKPVLGGTCTLKKV